LTGEGISLATSQALALQKHILPLLLTNSRQAPLLNKDQLGVYRHAYQMIVRPYYRITRLALILNRYPLFAEWTIRILSRHPGLFQSILSANMGTFTASSLQPALDRHPPGQ
jgi:hypothetical protein